MRLFLLFILIVQISWAQSSFKKVPFGNSPRSNDIPQVPVRIPSLIKHPANNITNNPINRTPLTLENGGGISSIPNSLSVPNSFWAQSAKPVSFNFRSVNSSVYSFLNQFKSSLRIQDVSKEFEFIKNETDEINMQHVRIQQMYKGIPVYGGELILHGPPAASRRRSRSSLPMRMPSIRSPTRRS